VVYHLVKYVFTVKYGRDGVGKVREYVSHRARSPIPEIFYGTRDSTHYLLLLSFVYLLLLGIMYVRESSSIDYVM